MKISGVDIKLFGLYCAMRISLTKWLFSVMTRAADAMPQDAWVVKIIFIIVMLLGIFGLFKGAQWLTKEKVRLCDCTHTHI